MRWTVAWIAFAVAAVGFSPALDAGFHFEDFTYLALMKHLDSPWPLIVDNIFFVYYYRATGMLFWWLSVKLVGADAWWHNLIDLLLHAGNAALLGVLTARLARAPLAGLVAGIAFAVMPAAATTAMWLSDRYDPLALLFGTLALLAFERALDGSRRAAVLTAVALFLAITAKEVAYAIAAVMCVRLGWNAWQHRRLDIAVGVAIVVPIVAALLLRALTVQSLDATLGIGDMTDAVIDGTRAWWRHLPSALYGFHAVGTASMWLLGTVALVSAASIGLGIRSRNGDVVRLSMTGAILFVVPSLLQWPVTSLVLVGDGALAFPVNLRFYHLAVAGLALLLAAAWIGLRGQVTRSIYALTLIAVCSVWFGQTRDNATRWASDLKAASQSYLTLGHELGARTFPPGCRIELDAAALPGEIRPHIDGAVKAAVPVGAPILGCSITAGTRTYSTLVEGNLCIPEAWPGLGIRPYARGLSMQRIGNVCGIAFDGSDDRATPAPRFAFRVDADGHIEQTVVPSD